LPPQPLAGSAGHRDLSTIQMTGTVLSSVGQPQSWVDGSQASQRQLLLDQQRQYCQTRSLQMFLQWALPQSAAAAVARGTRAASIRSPSSFMTRNMLFTSFQSM
jgi:hypothetical protein